MMTQIVKSAIVPFSTSQMFDLVNDIEKYPLFLPWCPQAKIVSQTNDEVQATVYFAKAGFGKSFTTVNRLENPKKIEMRLLQGPFRHLEGTWHFEEVKNRTSSITLNLSFEFKNSLLSLALGPLFHEIANTLVDAFTMRAHQIYA